MKLVIIDYGSGNLKSVENAFKNSIKDNDPDSIGGKAEASNIYRGISYRKFNRKFTLADDIVVNGASLENGMLVIKLERIVPEEKKPRKITIK